MGLSCDHCILTMTASFSTACHTVSTLSCGSEKTCSARESSHTFPLHFPTVCGRKAEHWTYLTHLSAICGMDGCTRRATMYSKLHSFALFLSGSTIIRICLALRVSFFFLRIIRNYLALKLLAIRSSTVQCYGFYNIKSCVPERLRRRYIM